MTKFEFLCSIKIPPSKRSLHVHGRMAKTDGSPLTTTSLMKNHIFLNPGESHCVENTVCLEINNNEKSLTNAFGYFDVSIPLTMMKIIAK